MTSWSSVDCTTKHLSILIGTVWIRTLCSSFWEGLLTIKNRMTFQRFWFVWVRLSFFLSFLEWNRRVFLQNLKRKTFEPNTNYLLHCCSEDFISKPYCGVGYLPRQRFYREVQFLNLFPAGQLLQPRHPIPPNFLKLSVDLFDAGREWSLWRSCKRVEWLVNLQLLAIF